MVHRKGTACPLLPGALDSHCWGNSMFHLQENCSESHSMLQKDCMQPCLSLSSSVPSAACVHPFQLMPQVFWEYYDFLVHLDFNSDALHH